MGGYWAAAAAEGDAGRRSLLDNGRAISANPGWFFAKGGSGKALLITS